MIVLGVDPDLHTTGLAIADETRVYGVSIARVPREKKGEAAVIAMCKILPAAMAELVMRARVSPALVVVESQELYLGGRSVKATPTDLINLATVSGAALAHPYPARRPLPKEWKGNVPKAIHQARIAARYPGLYEILKASGIPEKDYTHVIDAVGLASWGVKNAS